MIIYLLIALIIAIGIGLYCLDRSISPFPLVVPEDLRNTLIHVDDFLSFSVSSLTGRMITIHDPEIGPLCVYDNGWEFFGGIKLKREITRKIRHHIHDFEVGLVDTKKEDKELMAKQWKAIVKKNENK